MYKLSLIPHSEVSQDYLNEIIRIKQISWPYSFDDQVNWMHVNLQECDIHVLLSLDDKFVGYLNLIQISVMINNMQFSGLGVGNVCTTVRGNGWGKELMLLTNNYLRKNKKIGLLFCRDRLVNFYCMCSWRKIDNLKLRVRFDNSNIVSMYFNYSEPVQLIEFSGKLF